MVSIKPRNLDRALHRAAADGVVTKPEFKGLTMAMIKDLANSPDGARSLQKMTDRVLAFLQPFGQPGGPRLSCPELKGDLELLAKDLGESVEEIKTAAGGAFDMAIGLAMYKDHHITVSESRELARMARKLVLKSEDPAATAGAFKKGLDQVLMVIGMSEMAGMDDIASATATKNLMNIEKFLATAAAKGPELQDVGKLSPDSPFALAVKEAFEGDDSVMAMNFFGAMVLAPAVDQELKAFDTTDLTGTAKLKMEQMAAKKTQAILDHLEETGHGGDLAEDVYRMCTGNFGPPEIIPEVVGELKDEPFATLQDNLAAFEIDADEGDIPGDSKAVANLFSAYKVGSDILMDEVCRRCTEQIRANAGDGKTYPDLGCGNRGLQAYYLDDADAKRLVDVAKEYLKHSSLPEDQIVKDFDFDPGRYDVIGLVDTADESTLQAVLVDKQTGELTPFGSDMNLIDGGPGDLVPEAVDSDGYPDGFKAIYELLKNGHKITLGSAAEGVEQDWSIDWFNE